MKKTNIYLDYAATTPLDPRVLKIMLPYMKDKFGNASSIHSYGQEARKAVVEARETIAKLLDSEPEEIIFTGTNTVSDNLAIQGVAKVALKQNKNHLITSAVEHHAVLDVFQALRKQDFKITILPVDKYGTVSLADLKKTITKKTALISIMYANNEVGTIQPIKDISKRVRKVRGSSQYPVFHTDAAAVVDYLELDVKKLEVDLMTLGAHKFSGPKGIGLLYIKKGTLIEPITYGGHHEQGYWPGTEPVALIVGMAEALKLAFKERSLVKKKVTQLRDRLIKGVLSKVPQTQLTGHPSKRLPDIASFVFSGAEGEAILLHLNDQGIAASSGSACTSGELKPSHVLLAMGIKPEIAHSSIRFSLGKKTTKKEIDYLIKVIPDIIKNLRKMVPKL